jgi:hypothetical protein
MTINLNVPEDIARHLAAHGEDLSRVVLEALALEGYRNRTLTEEEIRRLLSFASRFDVHAFLKQHGVYLNYGLDDLKQDIEASSPFPCAA